MSILIKFCVVV